MVDKLVAEKTGAENALLTHSWSGSPSLSGGEILTFTVQKAGTSTIQFTVEDNKEPAGVSVRETARQLAFFHSSFEPTINVEIARLITSVGAEQQKE